jgi:4-hydroxybenzoate polyprenyltransferase
MMNAESPQHPTDHPVASPLLGYLQLMRFDKPIGTYLLFAPTLWALILAHQGWPPLEHLIIFSVGVVIMRAAGCTINDIADRKIDGFVERTRQRPLVTGAVTTRGALLLLGALLVIAFLLVLQTNWLTVGLSFVGAFLALLYPFMKRITHLPQFVLGTAFSWSIPMAFSAALGTLPPALWWLFGANLLWTVVYDTQYAMVDREDDLAVGVKSTAILFGDADRRIIAVLQLASLFCFLAVGRAFDLDWPWYSGVAVVGALFTYHQVLIRHRDRAACFKAFNQSKWIGAIILLALLAQYAL